MLIAEFDDAVCLEGENLKLRTLVKSDRSALHFAASDPETWAGHPAMNRHEPDIFDPYFDFLLRSGGTLVVLERSSDKIIGCSRYYTSEDINGGIAIGFTFLNHRYWGGAYNREMKALMLDHAFKSFEKVWLHIAPNNIRSQRATAKIGATYADTREIDLGSGKKMAQRWCLARDTWQDLKTSH